MHVIHNKCPIPIFLSFRVWYLHCLSQGAISIPGLAFRCGKIGSEYIATQHDLILEHILKMYLMLSEHRDNGFWFGVLLPDLWLGEQCGLLPLLISCSQRGKEAAPT